MDWGLAKISGCCVYVGYRVCQGMAVCRVLLGAYLERAAIAWGICWHRPKGLAHSCGSKRAERKRGKSFFRRSRNEVPTMPQIYRFCCLLPSPPPQVRFLHPLAKIAMARMLQCTSRLS